MESNYLSTLDETGPSGAAEYQLEGNLNESPKPKLIVVLEDEPDIMAIVTLILSSDGHQVEQCKTVKEFYDVFSHKKPDLFVLDISLPDGNGLDVCQAIKENPATTYIPVLLMSAHTHYNVTAGRHDDFIGKPFNIMDFRNKVKRYA